MHHRQVESPAKAITRPPPNSWLTSSGSSSLPSASARIVAPGLTPPRSGSRRPAAEAWPRPRHSPSPRRPRSRAKCRRLRGVGLHPQRAGQVHVLADRVRPSFCRSRRSISTGRTSASGVSKYPPGPKVWKPPSMIRPLPSIDRVLELLQFRRREGRGIDVAEDIDVVFARLEQFHQVAGLRLLDVPRIDADGIDLDVPRGVQRTAEELLLHAEIAFDIQHVQAALEHLHERA